MSFNRRDFLKVSAAAAAAGTMGSLAGCGGGTAKAGGHLVVVGGGFGGATVAKYVRMWSQGGVNVTLIERNPAFVSCPISNLVIGGIRKIEDITTSYDALSKKHGVKVVRGNVSSVNHDKRVVTLSNGETISYDRLVLSPGIDFMWETAPGLTKEASESGEIPHAWKAGPQTLMLQKQLQAMNDGGVYALCIPKAPYRCPPGPYERACMVATYLKAHKPRSKVLLLDANEDIQSKKGLFMKAWKDRFPGMVEYRANHGINSLDIKSKTVKFEFGDAVKADVLNVVPGHRAGDIAAQAGLITVNNRWCGVDWRSMESTAKPGIHVLGDSTMGAPGMPKSGHMTTQHAKIAAAAIVNLMSGKAVDDEPMIIANTCYSFVDDKNAVHVASVHKYNASSKTYDVIVGGPKQAAGTNGLSTAPTEVEAKYAMAWARNVWADMML